MVVVGAGISGVACARVLQAAGAAVTILDRGKVAGGRMADKRHDGRPVDIGASYFTVSDPRFDVVVQDWQQRGLARPWTDTFAAVSADPAADPQWQTKTGSMRWGAPTGLRSLVTDLATPLTVHSRTEVRSVDHVDGAVLVDGQRADAVVLAMPDPQARRLLDPGLGEVTAALDDPFQPVLVLTAGWPQRCWVPFDGAFVNGHPTIGWIADDGRRRGDDAPLLVAHSTAAFAEPYLADPAAAVPEMLAAVRAILDLDVEPTMTHLHRWTYAKPAQTRTASFLLTDQKVGICGDAWSERPRVESAWVSGTELGTALLEKLGLPTT